MEAYGVRERGSSRRSGSSQPLTAAYDLSIPCVFGVSLFAKFLIALALPLQVQ
jgi:hypothetical protein